jgi:hypothetical protein
MYDRVTMFRTSRQIHLLSLVVFLWSARASAQRV